METMICSKCEETQSIDQFRKDSHNASGYNSLCNSCHAKNQRNWRKNNQDVYNTAARKYYKKNAERIKEQRKKRREAKKNGTYKIPTPASQRKASSDYYKRTGWKRTIERRWKKRGIKNMTYDLYEEMLIQQNFKCLICDGSHSDEKKLHVDHNHNTGRVRGLLCNNCNNGMGKLGDSIERLQKTINYLIKTDIHE